MTVKLSPVFVDAQLDSSGNPYSGAKLFTYAAGSTTKQTAYQDSAGSVQHTNPIVLNSRGEPPAPIWLTAGSTYKLYLTTPTDSDPPVTSVRVIDNVSGVNDTTSAFDQWIASGLTPTFVSATSFTFAGDQTSTFHVGRRLKTTNSGGTVYSTITASAFGASTTITVTNDSGSLDSGLSAVSYGIGSATNPSLPLVDPKYIALPRSYLSGYGLTNNGSDATNDIDFAVGAARDSTNAANLIAATAMTKQLDVAWAAGTNQGGRMSAAAIANTTYFCYVIRKDADGTCDFGFDTSATAPTMPSGYTYFRRIGAILREGGSIVAFSQVGDYFRRKATILDVNAANPGGAAVTRTLSVPNGVKVLAIVRAAANASAGTDYVHLSDLAANDEAPSTTVAPLIAAPGISGSITGQTGDQWVMTNTSAQIRSRMLTGTNATLLIATHGWWDFRGRDD